MAQGAGRRRRRTERTLARPPRSRPRGRTLTRRLLALAFGIGVAAALAGAFELWWRRVEAGPVAFVPDPPGLKYAFLGEGPDRGRGWHEDRTPPAKPGAGRVVCLGDSVTFGVSVNPRDAWPSVLKAALGRSDVDVMNFGVPGYDAEQVATLAESRLDDWQPDVVVWGNYTNDVYPTYLLYQREGASRIYVGSDVPSQWRLLPEPASLWLLRRSAAFRRLQGAAYARAVAKDGLTPPDFTWYERHLDRIVSWASARDVPLVVLLVPPHALTDESTCPALFAGAHEPCDSALDLYAKMSSALSTRGLTWLDGLAAYRATGRSDLRPREKPDPDHPGPAGHAALARAVLPAVRAALWPEGEPPRTSAPTDRVRRPRHPPRGDRE